MSRALLWGTTLVALSLGIHCPRLDAQNLRADVVIEWNAILQSTLPASASEPRVYAMMHIAMFDAINSIEREFGPYRVRVPAGHAASSVPAAAQAAHDILVALLPASALTFDRVLETTLSTLPPRVAREGARVGRAVALEILAWRQNDGSSAPPPSFVLPALPGLWQPTPPEFLPAGLTHFPNIEPFALLTPTLFLPPPPPTLISDEYTAAFNEVKAIGSLHSTTRTQDQTLTARLWDGVVTRTTLFGQWNNVARDVSRDRGLSLVETARLFAMLNAAIHDGLQTSQSSKFTYGLWRPVTAIQRADEDLNPLTHADKDWLPLLTTPPYPAYAGNNACVGASAARTLANVVGTNDVKFSVTWTGLIGPPSTPDVTRKYETFWSLAVEQERSRVWGGIHYSFDGAASQISCVKLADYIFKHFMRPNRRDKTRGP
jgi:hypothetical protein